MGVYGNELLLPDLEASVKSIRGQTITDWEFLISDTGSAVTIRSYLDRLAREDPRIKLIRQDGAIRLPNKLNLCLAAARGEFIARQDADDRSLPARFEKQLFFLNEHPEISFAGCSVYLREGETICGERCFPLFPETADFRFSLPYIHPSLMFRRKTLAAVDGYSESPRAVLCEDYDLLLRMYAKGLRGANLPDKLYEYQVSDQDYKKRKFRHRYNESVTRWRRFRDLGMLPRAFPYVVKPLAVGLLPGRILQAIHRKMRYK